MLSLCLQILFLGEVHLQKCLTDLFDMGQTNVKVSEPTVSFMETIIPSNSNVSLDNQIVVSFLFVVYSYCSIS